jgi:Raf kinase inhibitor-like YbhB/YbcL family protein
MTTRALLAGSILFLCGPAAAAMTLHSADLADGAKIAAAQIYTRCGGQNVSPELSWSGVPAGTRSLALTMIDLDVKPAQWSHWVVVNIPPGTTGLARGAAALPAGASGVESNFGDAFYDGPCPPTGSGVHHYRLTIWALPQATITLPPGGKAMDVAATLSKAARDHASLTGTVER